jgi:hypothetical protein
MSPGRHSPGKAPPVSESAREYMKGDRVRQLPTGLQMVVEEVYAPLFVYRCRCSWKAADGTMRHDVFRVEQLELIPPDEPAT